MAEIFAGLVFTVLVFIALLAFLKIILWLILRLLSRDYRDGFAGFADAGRADRLAAAVTAGQTEGFFSEFFVTYPPSVGLIKERAGELTLFLSLQSTYLTLRC